MSCRTIVTRLLTGGMLTWLPVYFFSRRVARDLRKASFTEALQSMEFSEVRRPVLATVGSQRFCLLVLVICEISNASHMLFTYRQAIISK
jgi:hypothetical protein